MHEGRPVCFVKSLDPTWSTEKERSGAHPVKEACALWAVAVLSCPHWLHTVCSEALGLRPKVSAARGLFPGNLGKEHSPALSLEQSGLETLPGGADPSPWLLGPPWIHGGGKSHSTKI